jgi:hypothetical protein
MEVDRYALAFSRYTELGGELYRDKFDELVWVFMDRCAPERISTWNTTVPNFNRFIRDSKISRTDAERIYYCVDNCL